MQVRTLYPYQGECHESVIKNYEADVIKQLIVLFTGAGKTYILIKLLERMGFRRVLWLSFQEELVSQSALAFIKEKYDHDTYLYIKRTGFLEAIKKGWNGTPDFTIGCIKAETMQPNANVVMGSVMTIHKRLHLLEPDYFDAVICDEAHLYASISATKVLDFLKPKLLIGCTATPHRADGLSLANIFDKITFEYGLDKGIKDGYAAELDAIRIKTNINLDKVRTTAGEFNNSDLSNEVNTLQRNQLIVTKWQQYALGRQTIAFCVDISHAIDLAEAFKMNGINAVAVSSDEERTPERSENIARFKRGEIDVITNVGILVAGFDHIDTGAVIMACPTKSLTKYLQSVGRCARLKTKGFVDKFGQNALILDVVDTTTRHNLINAWELDKEKDINDRVFISQEKKDLLLAERLKKNTRLDFERKEDEKVKLISIPKIKINFDSDGMKKMATEKQLLWLSGLGFKVEENVYTMGMVQQIVGELPASRAKIADAKLLGYDVENKVITNNQINAIQREIWIKENNKKR